MSHPLLWDIFCRVIDNLGDIGVCWRLAADLRERGHSVRLWVDSPQALSWMAPGALEGTAGVEVLAWPGLTTDRPTALPGSEATPSLPPVGDVVIEAFGCDLPPGVLHSMAARARDGVRPAAVWLNLEYLSAQGYVERSHRLQSPQFTGIAAGMVKWFFFPGFTPRTGGLLREPGLLQRQAILNADLWRRQKLGLSARPGERWVSCLRYPHAPLAQLIDTLAAQEHPHTLLLAGAQAVPALGLEHSPTRGNCRIHTLPFMPQSEFDALLWACDVNLVRGEDSFVRAQWAAKPMLWHIYPQDDAAHWPKLAAFEDRYLEGAPRDWARSWSRLQALWNGAPAQYESEFEHAWNSAFTPQALAHAQRWRASLLQQEDLSTQLIRHVEQCLFWAPP